MARVRLPRPPVLVSGDDVVHGKPSPEGYLQAAERLAVDVRRSVVIEDTPAGVEAGRAAGARVIGLESTDPTLSQCDVLAKDLTAVRAAAPSNGWSIRLLIDPARLLARSRFRA